jgi:hypothetical protein
MLSFMVGNPDKVDSVTIKINGKEGEYVRVGDAVNGTTCRIYFIVVGRKRETLYWYTEYDGVMTTQNLYLNMVMMSTGDVVCGVWETRCNRPYQALLLCTKKSGYTECVMMKCKDFRQVYPGATLVPSAKFDEASVMQ